MAQFGVLLEKMSRAQALSGSVAASSIATQRVGDAVGEGVRQLSGSSLYLRTEHPTIIAQDDTGTIVPEPDTFQGLIQALDQHDKEIALAREKIEAERQTYLIEKNEAFGFEVEKGKEEMGFDGLGWMGFGTGPEELGGDEDFSALLDPNAFATEPNTGNLFSSTSFENYQSQPESHVAPFPDDTSPLIDSSFASAISALLSTFDNSDGSFIPDSTATQLFSEFSSPEDVGLGNLFPPLAQSSRYPPDPLAKPDAAFEDINLASLADKGVFGLPLMGGFHAQHISPKLARQSPLANAASPAAGSTKDLFGPPSTPILASPALLQRTSFSIEWPRASASPALAQAQLYSGGRSQSVLSTGPALKKKKPYEPTGTRTSRPLLDASAPTMVKKYAAPGKTTRKVIPVGFQKKLKLQSNELGDADLPEDADGEVVNELMTEIEQKRRKNCVAARESRRRKLDFQNGLKDEIKGWREWAEQVEAVLKSVGREDLMEMFPDQPEAMSMEE